MTAPQSAGICNARLLSRKDNHFLFQLAASRLRDRLSDVKRDFDDTLELHSACAMATNNAKIKNIIHGSMLQNGSVTVDEEFLPFAQNVFDLVLCPLNLQIVNDLPGTLWQIEKSLKKDGLFLAVLIGGASLIELRDCLLQAEAEILGGVSPRVAPMIDLRDAAGLLQRARFALPVADSEKVELVYRDLFHLMQDLRALHLQSRLHDRYKKFTPRSLFLRAAQLYQERYPDPDTGGIKATLELIHLSGWKG